LADAIALMKTIKKAAVEAVAASKPTDIIYGTVLSVNPLQIEVEQKLKLGAAQLILTGNVTDRKILADFGGEKTEITLYNGLTAGESVILIRQTGGQKFIVLDRMEVVR